MPTISGHITAVQEARFRLLMDDGRTYLLTLSQRASLDGGDLCTFQESNAYVTVEFEGPPNLASAVAYRIELVRKEKDTWRTSDSASGMA